ncbi:cathepsin B [Biomphalaria pfeifferi]|uniref:Cathepsin B-like cysteine proteinase n=1 Tax=Biomphalaria pfeifferi TaxID=112525 RepID=A0AAD8ARD0_BIOPF|nr:cathepsin B [Biomphalaria pfeifferi]
MSIMRILVAICGLLAVAFATPFHIEPLSDAEIFYINHVANTTWKAGRNFHPAEIKRARALLGVNMAENKAYNRIHLKYKQVQPRNDLPDNFDPRTKWPDCASLNEIRDQANCGSCWAFGSAEAMTDRICISGKGNIHISAEDINDCCKSCGMGCNGGYPAAAWEWYVDTGVVSGGQYGTNEGCMPYSLPHCDHHTTGKYQPCPAVVPTPKCEKKCRTGYPKSYSNDKTRGKKSYGVRGVQSIMQELVDNGPVTAAFDVYSDFLSYKTGVYRHTTGSYEGGHAVKIIGYGTESGQDYWLVANSWNEDWGDKGFFKIAKGKDECGIESSIVAGDP